MSWSLLFMPFGFSASRRLIIFRRHSGRIEESLFGLCRAQNPSAQNFSAQLNFDS
jgi:hypothetical protein